MSSQYLEKLFSLEGQVAVVIGGTGVLGGALCDGIGQAGAHVVVSGRSGIFRRLRVVDVRHRSVSSGERADEFALASQFDKFSVGEGLTVVVLMHVSFAVKLQGDGSRFSLADQYAVDLKHNRAFACRQLQSVQQVGRHSFVRRVVIQGHLPPKRA